MSLKNDTVELLERIATILDLKGENGFKVRAFQNAARTIALLTGDLKEMTLSGALLEEKGIGQAIYEKIRDFVEHGRSAYLRELEQSTPPGLFDLLQIEGLGPKKVRTIYEKLGISTVGELEYACHENRLLTLDGFGPKSQSNILSAIERLKKGREYFHFDEAKEEGEAILGKLKESGHFDRIELAGSIRRRKEIVRDIDIVSSSESPDQGMNDFTSLPQVESVIAQGSTKSSVRLKSGIHVDLRIVPPGEYYPALVYFTGSKEHNVTLRGIAKEKGLKLNEYGLFKKGRPIPCESESDLYQALGYRFIPPELREDHGEFEASLSGTLPRLVEPDEIRGIFHLHTTYSDGKNSLEEMVNEAVRRGYQYVGISDHSRSAFYAHGLELDDVKRQRDEIARLQDKTPQIRIFRGIESDILENGALDYPEKVLASFDFIIGSIHSRFKMKEEEMTGRILEALSNPYLTILGHLTGRLLLSRAPYAFDLDAVIETAKKHHVVIELNANPHRFDIDWRDCRKLKEQRVKVSINPDAHAVEHLRFTEYGVGIARKGWLSSRDVFNTLALPEMEKALAARRKTH